MNNQPTFTFRLVKYNGPHTDKLYHVVDDNGVVVRNATVLEAELWEHIHHQAN